MNELSSEGWYISKKYNIQCLPALSVTDRRLQEVINNQFQKV